MSIIVTVSLHMPVSAEPQDKTDFADHLSLPGKSSERQGGILGTFANFLWNTKGVETSDSGLSSGDSVPPRQHQDENKDKETDDTENREEQKEENGNIVGDAVPSSDPIPETEAKTKYEALNLLWEELPQKSNADDQATTEPRLIE
jgi:hypothetical protein